MQQTFGDSELFGSRSDSKSGPQSNRDLPQSYGAPSQSSEAPPQSHGAPTIGNPGKSYVEAPKHQAAVPPNPPNYTSDVYGNPSQSASNFEIADEITSNFAFNDETIRRGFIRKVYFTLSVIFQFTANILTRIL